MEIVRMSLTRALAEVKMTDAKITSAIATLNPIAFYQKSKPLQGYNSADDYTTKQLAHYQSLMDLILYRVKLQCAISVANAHTEVVVNGKTYTISQAIQLKNNKGYYFEIVSTLKNKYTKTMLEFERVNSDIYKRLDNLVASSLSKDVKTGSADYDAIAKPFLAQNEFSILDPLKVLDVIQLTENFYNEWCAELDFKLSEINSTTFIEV